MTDIDTAAIRAACDAHGWYSAVILDLCDALDAARAAGVVQHDAVWSATRRAEAAEARIAAALALIRDRAYIDWKNVERAHVERVLGLDIS